MAWQQLPVVISEGAVMTFSGGAVVDRANSSGFGRAGIAPLVAIYTGHDPATKIQSQYLAYGLDHDRPSTAAGKVFDLASTESAIPRSSDTPPASGGY